MKAEKVDRVAIAVRDINKAMDFFEGSLGAKFDEPRSNEKMQWRATYSDLGLELLESTAPDSIIDRFLQKRGEGVFAIVIKVADIEEGRRAFQERGIRPAGELFQRGMLKEAAFHPKDTFGVHIVLCEYEAPHPATCAALHKWGRSSSKVT